MEFAEWFVEMCNRHNVTPTDVAKAIGVSSASASYWVSGRNTPKQTTLARIEDYFQEKYDDTLQSIKDEERALLHSYRTMTEEQKKMMQTFIRGIKNAD